MPSAVQYSPFPKVTALGAVKLVEKQIIKVFTDSLFEDFKVYKSSNGRPGFWEVDVTKVQRLIDAFKSGHNVKNSCFYAGITPRQWQMFNDTYPEFRYVREACESNLTFGAMESVKNGIKEKPDLAFKYVEKRNDFNFDSRKVDEERPLQPTVVVPVQINNHIDREKIKDDARRFSGGFVSEQSAGSEGGSAHRVENTV